MSGPLAQVSGSSAVAASQPFSGGHSAVEGTEAVVAAVAATTFASAPASPPAGGAGHPLTGRLAEASDLAGFEKAPLEVQKAFAAFDFDEVIKLTRESDFPQILNHALYYAIINTSRSSDLVLNEDNFKKTTNQLLELHQRDPKLAHDCIIGILFRHHGDAYDDKLDKDWLSALSQWLTISSAYIHKLWSLESGVLIRAVGPHFFKILEENPFSLKPEHILNTVDGVKAHIRSDMRERAHALVAAQPESDRRTALLAYLS